MPVIGHTNTNVDEDGPAPGLAQLTAENALLRRKLQIPPEQRIIAEVVARRLDAFLRGATAKVTRADVPEEDECEGESGGDGSSGVLVPGGVLQRRVVVSEALGTICAEKEALERRLAEVMHTVVAPLQDTVVSLERDKAILEGRVGELEASAAGRSPPVFMTELAALRRSETVYRNQLTATQENEEATARRATAALEEGLEASRALPDYARVIGEFREALRAARAAQALSAVELEEQKARYTMREEMASARAHAELICIEERVGVLEKQLRDADARETLLATEKQQLEEEVRALREENQRLLTQPVSASVEDSSAAKRQRIEAEISEGGHSPSVRHDFIRFWYEGHDRIRTLEAKLAEAERLSGDLRVSQGRVAQLERSRESAVAHLASVAQEVAKSRKENQQLRAQNVGLEVERDHLMHVVATTVGVHMTHAELADCCQAIREAAQKEAAASAAVVADPATVQQAVRRAQELKGEVARMHKQKEKLSRFIAIQQERIGAQVEQRALATVSASRSTNDSSDAGAAAAKANAQVRALVLPQFLDAVSSSAKDILWESELAAIGLLDDRTAIDAAMNRHRDGYVALQVRLVESQEKLLTSQRRLQEVISTSGAAKEATEQATEALSSALQSRDAAMRALEEANSAMLRHSAGLSAERRELRRQLTAVTNFAERVLCALREVFGLFQKEAAYVRELRAMAASDRQEMMELVRGSCGSSGGDMADGEAALGPVVTALERLSSSLQTHVEETHLDRGVERTAYLRRLVALLQQQEVRLGAMQVEFMEASKEQAASLAQHVVEAQREWDGAWKARCQAAEAQREQLTALGLTRNSLYRALEGATVTVPTTTPSGGAAKAAKESGPSVPAPPTTPETLHAIGEFIAQARQRLAACEAAPVAAPAPVVAPSAPVPPADFMPPTFPPSPAEPPASPASVALTNATTEETMGSVAPAETTTLEEEMHSQIGRSAS